MTLKIGSRSPKSNQLVPPSQQCICASLVKIRPSVQKITRVNEATRTQTSTGSPPKTNMSPPLRLGGHNFTLKYAAHSRQPFCFDISFRHQGQTNISDPHQNLGFTCIFSSGMQERIRSSTVMIQSFRTNRFGKTVQTQIRLLLEEQSDQGLHCLLFQSHLFDEIP